MSVPDLIEKIIVKAAEQHGNMRGVFTSVVVKTEKPVGA